MPPMACVYIFEPIQYDAQAMGGIKVEWAGLLSLAFALGLIHALDADHLVAVSALAGGRGQSLRRRLSFSLRWALGHGSSVLLLGSLVLLFGVVIPDKLSYLAEELVGIMLVGIGSILLISLLRKRNALYMHSHDSLLVHVHVQRQSYLNPLHAHRHGTVLVGLIHGVAGFVPLLALLPLGQSQSPIVAMTSLVVFCIAVLVAMVVMGGFLGNVFNALQTFNKRFSDYLSFSLGLLSVGMGLWLVLS